MNWKVVWKPEAERRLTSLWLDSANREAIRSAADQLDELLALDPENAGESRERNRRIVLIHPLAARVAVYASLRTVLVLAVWEY